MKLKYILASALLISLNTYANEVVTVKACKKAPLDKSIVLKVDNSMSSNNSWEELQACPNNIVQKVEFDKVIAIHARSQNVSVLLFKEDIEACKSKIFQAVYDINSEDLLNVKCSD